MKLQESIQRLDAYADGLANAPHFRARIHIAEHLYDVLDEIYEEIERIVKADKVAKNEAENVDSTPVAKRDELSPKHRDEPKLIKPLRFRKATMAEGAKVLLEENGQLHGKKIEQLLKDGGYKSEAEHFQSSLAVALRRDGSFENIGGNTWKLNIAGHGTVMMRLPEITNGVSQ
jgi:hypothetical protein